MPVFPQKPCRGCRAPFTPTGPCGLYCPVCRESTCSSCGRRAGKHSPGCKRAKGAKPATTPTGRPTQLEKTRQVLAEANGHGDSKGPIALAIIALNREIAETETKLAKLTKIRDDVRAALEIVG